eukprot:TRINITY_DN21924_c0_g1_i1.p1 TRINITY_DN21924_c0_g1~~TRINITY_DN21924_c0_g1_i1.p1  ORF type:complete len:815 (+),score=182.03 TRINITY_DN21924_c0_g1_i1:701-3145(+)
MPLKQGQAGGLNFAFSVEKGETVEDSAVKLMVAAKGDKDEMVNFKVLPSPYYESTFRFEVAGTTGHYLAFRPPSGFRVLPHVDGAGSRCIVDFTIIDFSLRFKFIEIEEVLRLAMHSAGGWITLNSLRENHNVVSYFRDVLARPVWDHEDFENYFQGHSDTWEYKADDRMVRYRRREERLRQELAAAGTAEQAAQLLDGAAVDAVVRLSWQDALPAFKLLAKHDSSDMSSVLACMNAKRKLIGALANIVKCAQSPPVNALINLADEVRRVSGDPGLTKIRNEAVDTLAKHIMEKLYWAEKRSEPLHLELGDFVVLLSLPSFADKGSVLVGLMEPQLSKASAADIVAVVEAALAASATAVSKAASAALIEALERASSKDVSLALRTLLPNGLEERACGVVLRRRASALSTGDLAAGVAALAERSTSAGGGATSSTSDLTAAVAELDSRTSLADVLASSPADMLLSLAVSGTKTDALASILPVVATAATSRLWALSVADVVRLLLALSKAKGQPLSARTRDALLAAAAEVLRPKLRDMSTVDVIKVGLAAAAGGASSSGAGAGANGGLLVGARDLLEATAEEAVRRLGLAEGVPAAQLLLLTQALVPLGARHASVRRIVEHWTELLQPRKGAGSALPPDQLAKLTDIMAPILADLDIRLRDRCLEAAGNLLLSRFDELSSQSRQLLEKQLAGKTGLRLWTGWEKMLRHFPQLQKDPSPNPCRRRDSRPRSRSGARGGAVSRRDAGGARRYDDPRRDYDYDLQRSGDFGGGRSQRGGASSAGGRARPLQSRSPERRRERCRPRDGSRSPSRPIRRRR